MLKNITIAFALTFMVGVMTVPIADAKKCQGSIGNRVWEDLNQDGIQQDDEAGIPWVGVWLYQGNKFFTDATDARGHYKFNELCEGRYVVVVKIEDVDGRYQTYDPDGRYDNRTVVWLDGDKDKHTKADFSYIYGRAPETGAGISLGLAIAGVATISTMAIRRNRRHHKKA